MIIQNHISSDDFKNLKPKDPEKRKQLEEFASKITMFDNPILMYVTFKKLLINYYEENISVSISDIADG